MEENNKENLSITNNDQSEKIGFQSYDRKKARKMPRYQEELPDKKYRRVTKIFLALTLISTILSVMFYFLPVFSSIIGLFLGLLIVVFAIILPSIATLGIIYTSEGYRSWLGHSMDVPSFFLNLTNNFQQLVTYFPYFGYTALGISIVTIILMIIGVASKKKGYVYYLVASIICLIIVILTIILYYIVGISKMN